MDMNRANLEVHIEELILDGFDSMDQAQLGLAVEKALSLQLEMNGLPTTFARGVQISGLDGGSFSAVPGTAPEQLGNQIAQAVYGGLSR